MVRIIPCLDVKDGRVVKGVQFVNLKDAGDPAEIAKRYCEEGADELVFLDISASLEERKTNLGWVQGVAQVASVPFSVGGGIASLAEMEELFNLGANKVSINTAAVEDPALIYEASRRFGSERIVVAIDAVKNASSSSRPRLEVVINSGRELTRLEVVSWAKIVERLGAGEILLTSKDADGTKDGYDIEMTRAVAQAVDIPVIASGGAGTLEHMYLALTEGKASAVLAASIFHFREFTIPQVKKYLYDKGIAVKI